MSSVSRKMRPDVLENDLGYNCYRLSQLVRDETQEHLKRLEADITPEQWHLLLCLSAAPEGLTPTDLAVSAQRDKTTISRMIDIMEKHDLVDKVYRAKDGRSYIIRLAPRSHRILAQIRAEGGPVTARYVFAALNGAEHELLLALLQKCRRSAGDLENLSM